jgi:hypothetical protein
MLHTPTKTPRVEEERPTIMTSPPADASEKKTPPVGEMLRKLLSTPEDTVGPNEHTASLTSSVLLPTPSLTVTNAASGYDPAEQEFCFSDILQATVPPPPTSPPPTSPPPTSREALVPLLLPPTPPTLPSTPSGDSPLAKELLVQLPTSPKSALSLPPPVGLSIASPNLSNAVSDGSEVALAPEIDVLPVPPAVLSRALSQPPSPAVPSSKKHPQGTGAPKKAKGPPKEKAAPKPKATPKGALVIGVKKKSKAEPIEASPVKRRPVSPSDTPELAELGVAENLPRKQHSGFLVLKGPLLSHAASEWLRVLAGMLRNEEKCGWIRYKARLCLPAWVHH